jgi:pimeloyl-ACP methyl ester carboxylesterase
MRALLVHGLGRTPASLARLGWALRRAGHDPEYLAYFAFAEPYQQIRQRLVTRLRELALDRQPVALLGHSLGGLLLRHALADVPELPVHQLIMLGTPNRPPRRAREAVRWLPFRLFARSCGEVLASAEFYDEIPALAVPYTIIAGTGGHRLLGGPFGAEPHDGFVAVAETPIHDTDQPILLPVAHTFMMNDAELQKLVLTLLDGPVQHTVP